MPPAMASTTARDSGIVALTTRPADSVRRPSTRSMRAASFVDANMGSERSAERALDVRHVCWRELELGSPGAVDHARDPPRARDGDDDRALRQHPREDEPVRRHFALL